jgi:hypothetical protein
LVFGILAGFGISGILEMGILEFWADFAEFDCTKLGRPERPWKLY